MKVDLARTLCTLLVLGATSLADAAVQRTFVASYGLTANTAFDCSLVKPCRAFSEAIGVTAAGGEVIVLDSAGYGAVTITQSVSIVAPTGIFAGVTVFSGDGVVVNAGANDIVKLRGLTINGLGGANGIVVNSVGLLGVANVRVSGFSNRGLNFAAADGRLSVTDSAFEDNQDAGLHAQAASGIATVTIHRSRFDNNALNGAVIATNASGAIFDSVASNNRSTGFLIDAGGIATLADCKVADTYDFFFEYGVLVRGTGTRAMIARCDVFGAFSGFAVENGARVQITDSSAQTGGAGFTAQDNLSDMVVDHGTATNLQTGFSAFGSGVATLHMSNCNSTANNYGVYVSAPSVVESRQNNTMRGNSTNVFGTLTPFGAL